MNIRRNLVIAIGAGAVASPFRSFAQQKDKVWRVGLLMPQRRPASIETHYYGAFLQGMRELAYVEGTNLKAEWRFADGDARAYLASQPNWCNQKLMQLLLQGCTAWMLRATPLQ